MLQTEQYFKQCGLKWIPKGKIKNMRELILDRIGPDIGTKPSKTIDTETEKIAFRDLLFDDGYLVFENPTQFMEKFSIDGVFEKLPVEAWRKVKMMYSYYVGNFVVMRLEFAVIEDWDDQDPKKMKLLNQLVKGYEIRSKFHPEENQANLLRELNAHGTDFREKVVSNVDILGSLIELLRADYLELLQKEKVQTN